MHNISGWLVVACYFGHLLVLGRVYLSAIVVYDKILVAHTRLPIDQLVSCIRIFLRLT